jgi:hypothetical protein
MKIDLIFFLLYTGFFLYFWKFFSVNRMNRKLNKILRTGDRNYLILLGFFHGFMLAMFFISALIRFYDIAKKIFCILV